MPVFSGTNADENIVGTSEDDIFHSSRGQDFLSGLAGFDTLNADFSTALNAYGNFSVDEFGLKGTLGDRDTNWRTEFFSMEKIVYASGGGADQFYLSFDRTVAGYMIAINAGAGFDSLILNLTLGQHAALTGNAATSIGNAVFAFSNIEQYYLDLGKGNDDITFGAGNDDIAGGEGDDRLIGMLGNDVLEGQWGGDYLDGGDGNDRLYAFDSYSSVDQGTEIDTLKGGAGDDLLSIGYGDSADGGTGTDRLSLSLRSGTAGAVIDLSIVFAGGTITVGGGTITGVETYDTIYATDYADTITTGNAPGSFQTRIIFGFGGDDIVNTGNGGDRIDGGAGNDVIHAGGDADLLAGDVGNDRIFGDGGIDTLYGGVGDDELHGGSENDLIIGDDFGENGADQLFGDDGDDRLVGGAGADFMSGGAGNDTYLFEGQDSFAEAVGGGIDIVDVSQTFVFLTSASYVLTPGAEIETLTAETLSASVALTLTGNEFGQLIIGSAGHNVIDGGGGADTLRGGLGDDLYIVDNAADIIVELVGGGADRVAAKADYSLAAGVSVETLSTDNDAGTTAITLRGNEIDNRIIGNAGANALYGGAGDDRIEGGGGNDRIEGGLGTDDLFGGAGADVFAFAQGDSRNAIRSDGKKYMPDMIWDFASGEDRIDLSAIDAKFGTAANDAFTFIGTAAFGGHAGELRYEVRGAQLLLLGDTDGNGVGDFLLVLTASTLQGADFIL